MTPTDINLIQIGMHAGRGGGVDRYFDGALSSMKKLSIPCKGFVFGENGDDHPSNVSLLGSRNSSLVKRLQATSGVVRESLKGYPVATVCASHFALYGLPATRFLRGNNQFALVSHFHGPWALESAAEGSTKMSVRIKGMLERYVLRRSTHVISDSNAFRELAIKIHGISPQKISAIFPGVVSEPFVQASKFDREAAKLRMGWDLNKKTILCIRRLAHRMGLDRLIQAFKKCSERNPDWQLVIGGRGKIESELRAQIQASGQSESIKLAGFISEENLPFAYRAAEFTIIPSVSLEGFGLVAIESMAAGTPVIVTPVGGMPEVVAPLGQQLVLSGNEVDVLEAGLMDAIDGCLCLPTQSECMAYVEREFSWERAVENMMKVYRAALHQRLAK